MTTTAISTATPASPRQMSHGPALWLLGSLLVTFLAASSAPSPLYAVYRDAWGFSALTLTLVFSVYAFALLGALLVLGGLSDHLGRRSVLLGALVLEIVATVLFHQAQSVHWLFAARALQGLATGIATSTISAGLLDLHRERGALVNSVAPMLGTGAGALGASVLLQFLPAPTRLVFEVLLVAFVLQALLTLFLPETVRRRPLPWQALKPVLAVPAHARSTMRAVLPLAVAQWALAGFYLSLGPTLARTLSGSSAPVVGGALIGAMLASAAGSVLVVRHHSARTALLVGASALATGVVVTLAGMELHSALTFLAGSLIAGTGFGAAFNGSLRSVVPLAAPHERAALMATFFAVSYLGFSLPAVAAGLSTGHFGLYPTALGYAATLVVLFVGALVRIRRSASI